MSTSLSGYSSVLPADAILGSGVLFLGSSPLSASRGGISFDPGTTYRQLPYDGQTAPVAGLDRVVYREPKFKGKLLQFSDKEFANYEMGATVEHGHAKKTTPVGANIFITSGQLLTNLRLIFERGGSAGFVEVVFPLAFCDKYSVQGNDGKDEGQVDCEFTARRDPTTTTEGDSPFYIREIASVS